MSFNKQDSTNTIIALAGRRTDASDTDSVRFPLSNVEAVRNNLYNLFIERQAKHLVCSAACGADLVALDVASRLNISSHIILPFSVAEFKRISVTDLPGNWGPIYDRIISEVLEHGSLQLLGYDIDDNLAFSKANKAIIKQAKSLVKENFVVLGVAVWEGKSHSKIDATREFLELAQNANFDTVTVPSN